MSEPEASPVNAPATAPTTAPTTAATTAPTTAASGPDSTRTGPGRLLVAVYALFALSASARAGVQIATEFSRAPVAYVLSGFAAAVYILATVTLIVGSPAARRIAVVSCSVEFVGVLAVGTWSLAAPATFPDATVWSGYGIGYGFVPLVLPVFGLLWLRRWTRRARAGRAIVPAAGDAGESGVDGADHVGAENLCSASIGPANIWARPGRLCPSWEFPFVVRVDEPKERLARTSTGRRSDGLHAVVPEVQLRARP
jgi:hypothetical protein